MEVKHIHPEYESDQQRKDHLKDTNRACLEAVGALRDPSAKHTV